MPNTIRNQFDKNLKYYKLMEAHKLCSKNKSHKKEVIEFNMKQEEYLQWLLEQLQNGTYRHGGYKKFYILKPKLREVQASRYIDRIVHRWVADNFLNPYFVKTFISTSYACIVGRGAHKATIDVQNSMKHCKNIWGSYYVLKIDVAHYFPNIDKEILVNILARKVKDPKLMNLLKIIIYSTEGDKGIPIGNYTSQVFANIYLNELDQYVKNVLRCKYYFRYMDDGVLLFKTKTEAKDALNKIRVFLDEHLKLELNGKTQVFKGKQGINFCGYKINEYRLKIRDRGKKNLKRKVKYLDNQVKTGCMTSKEAKIYLAGHVGYINIADTRNLENKLFGST